jgi:hypothetical protein
LFGAAAAEQTPFETPFELKQLCACGVLRVRRVAGHVAWKTRVNALMARPPQLLLAWRAGMKAGTPGINETGIDNR